MFMLSRAPFVFNSELIKAAGPRILISKNCLAHYWPPFHFSPMILFYFLHLRDLEIVEIPSNAVTPNLNLNDTQDTVYMHDNENVR